MNDNLYDEQSKKIGYIYEIKFLYNFKITDEKQNSSASKTNIISNNNESPNNISILKDTKIIKKENSEFTEIKEINKLNLFFQNQIKALISFYFFVDDLKSTILYNKQQTQFAVGLGKCFLVDEAWMKIYKNVFSYQKLIKLIQNIQGKYSIQEPKENIKKIFDKLDNEYIKELNNKEEGGLNELLKNFSAHTDNFIEKYKDKNILLYPCRYDMLNPETLEKINKTPGKEILSIIKDRERDYLINDGRLILKIESTSSNRYELLIGTFNFEIEKFIPELLFKYDLRDLMENHFEKLKKCKFESFIKSHSTSN